MRMLMCRESSDRPGVGPEYGRTDKRYNMNISMIKRNIIHIKERMATAVVGMVLASAACLTVACSSVETETAVPAGNGHDGPLQITARVAGTLEARSTYPEGNVPEGSDWYLAVTDKNNIAYGRSYKVAFNGAYGTLSEIGTGESVELRWDMLYGEWQYDYKYHFTLDNCGVNTVLSDRPNAAYYFMAKDDVTLLGMGMVFDESQKELYKAKRESEDGRINSNDILQGHAEVPKNGAEKRIFIDIPLYHLMSRVHVEFTSDIKNFEDVKSAKVWIDHLAEECYGINRMPCFMDRFAGQFPGIDRARLYIYPLIQTDRTLYIEGFSGGNYAFPMKYKYDPSCTDDEIFCHDLYLLGSTEKGEPLIHDQDGQGGSVWRTGRLILPPQPVQTSAELRPRLHIDLDGEKYSGVLPVVLTTGTGVEQFTEFGSGKDITLRVNLNDTPPYITFSAQVKGWEDRGEVMLGSQEAGIYSSEDFVKAVAAFLDYFGAGDDNNKKEAARKTLLRYGKFWTDSLFRFTFYNNFEEDTQEIPESCKIPSTYADNFEINLAGHTVYGVKGTDEGSGDTFENKMFKD